MYGIKRAKSDVFGIQILLEIQQCNAPIAYSHANNILSFNKKERKRERDLLLEEIFSK